MAAKGLILIMEEGSGRILAAKIVSINRVEYEFERLLDHFQFDTQTEISLKSISQTFAIGLKRVARIPIIQTDQNVTIPISSSFRPLP